MPPATLILPLARLSRLDLGLRLVYMTYCIRLTSTISRTTIPSYSGTWAPRDARGREGLRGTSVSRFIFIIFVNGRDLHCVYVHLHLDVPVNEHVESALADDVMDDEIAGPRSLLTAPRGVLPPPSSPPT